MNDDGEEREAILSRRQLLIAGALGGVGLATSACAAQPCLAPLPAPGWRPEPYEPPRLLLTFSRAPDRRNTPIDRVPEPVRSLLEDQRIYAAAGPAIPWPVLITLYGHSIAYVNPYFRSAYVVGSVDRVELRTIVDLADRVWREARPGNPSPTTDDDEVLAMRDGDDVFFARAFGPFRGGAAEELVARLRAVGEALISPSVRPR